MKVKHMIKLLSKLDPDMLIYGVNHGYSDCYTPYPRVTKLLSGECSTNEAYPSLPYSESDVGTLEAVVIDYFENRNKK